MRPWIETNSKNIVANLLRRGKQLFTNTGFNGGMLLTSDVRWWEEYLEDVLNPTSMPSMEADESGEFGVDLSITGSDVPKVVQKLCSSRTAGV